MIGRPRTRPVLSPYHRRMLLDTTARMQDGHVERVKAALEQQSARLARRLIELHRPDEADYHGRQQWYLASRTAQGSALVETDRPQPTHRANDVEESL